MSEHLNEYHNKQSIPILIEDRRYGEKVPVNHHRIEKETLPDAIQFDINMLELTIRNSLHIASDVDIQIIVRKKA